MYCDKCGNEIKEGEEFCNKCGNSIENEKKEEVSNSNQHSNNSENILKSKKVLILSIIVFIISGIGSSIFGTNNTIWEICRALLILSIVVFIVSLITCIVLIKRDKKKLPIWADVILAIILAFIVIFMISNHSANKFKKETKLEEEEIREILKNL